MSDLVSENLIGHIRSDIDLPRRQIIGGQGLFSRLHHRLYCDPVVNYHLGGR